MISVEFCNERVIENGLRFSKQLSERQRWGFDQISKEANCKIESISDIWAATDKNMEKLFVCPRCGKVLPTYSKVLTHTGNVDCRRRVAEINGHAYIPPGKIRYPCPVCKGSPIQKCNWTRHEQSVKHLENVEKQKGYDLHALTCTICNKTFNSKRAKRDLKRHMESKKHKKNVVLKV